MSSWTQFFFLYKIKQPYNNTKILHHNWLEYKRTCTWLNIFVSRSSFLLSISLQQQQQSWKLRWATRFHNLCSNSTHNTRHHGVRLHISQIRFLTVKTSLSNVTRRQSARSVLVVWGAAAAAFNKRAAYQLLAPSCRRLCPVIHTMCCRPKQRVTFPPL